jgi:hypothetical protein
VRRWQPGSQRHGCIFFMCCMMSLSFLQLIVTCLYWECIEDILAAVVNLREAMRASLKLASLAISKNQ